MSHFNFFFVSFNIFLQKIQISDCFFPLFIIFCFTDLPGVSDCIFLYLSKLFAARFLFLTVPFIFLLFPQSELFDISLY